MSEDMINRYYSPEQRQRLAQRRAQLGDDVVRAVEAEWPQLYARAQEHLDAGTDPADPRVQVLVWRMTELVEAFHGGDPEIRASLQRLYDEQAPALREQFGGPSPELSAYLQQARQAGRA